MTSMQGKLRHDCRTSYSVR